MFCCIVLLVGGASRSTTSLPTDYPGKLFAVVARV